MFRVETSGSRLLRAHLSGDARALLTRLVPGDVVLVEVSPRDDAECRIVGRPRGVRGR
ncbi:MAG: translation initiation factor IF-1 [Planctomycetes bacterium]|nr:translation initiation factor IF-1 [Planctomycetota bacterium]